MYDLIIVGGGASGFFCAINYSERFLNSKVLILEASNKLLSKVRISGGGRCNVTNKCSDPKEFIKNYPRGEKELLGPLSRFGSNETVRWFEDHGIPIMAESDGRMFPVSNTSESIIECFLKLCKDHSIQISCSNRVIGFNRKENKWIVNCTQQDYFSRNLVICSGSDGRIWDCLEELGHTIISPVASLFTFNVSLKSLKELSGISVNSTICTVKNTNLRSEGPVLITHWGLSGPAILKLSAWGARILESMSYEFEICINWLGKDQRTITELIQEHFKTSGNKQLYNVPMNNIPSRLWKFLCQRAQINPEMSISNMSKDLIVDLAQTISNDIYNIAGKSTFKDEFVTAGGIHLKEINFKTFESKICPNLFLAGEVLDIDGITGGFNFQAAWTGAWIISQSIDS